LDQGLNELKGISKKHGINLAFEEGEAETFVTDAPVFTKRIQIVEAKPVWEIQAT
jgi:diphthine-ammonia ligase